MLYKGLGVQKDALLAKTMVRAPLSLNFDLIAGSRINSHAGLPLILSNLGHFNNYNVYG